LCDPSTTYIYTLSLHDALPICQCIDKGLGQFDVRAYAVKKQQRRLRFVAGAYAHAQDVSPDFVQADVQARSIFNGVHLFLHDVRTEEHTSELQSLAYLVCRLLL